MKYAVQLNKKIKKSLSKLPRTEAQRILDKIAELADNPRPHGSKKLQGYELYRIRVGDWRIIYAIEDDVLLVLIVSIKSRGKAYKNLDTLK
jgi:mRNA interferase RelE/StbE